MGWQTLFDLVAKGLITSPDAATLAHAMMAAANQIAHGQDLTPDEVRALFGDAVPVAMLIAKTMFPAMAPEIAVGGVILSMSHKMTPEEEVRWMDRASGGPGH